MNIDPSQLPGIIAAILAIGVAAERFKQWLDAKSQPAPAPPQERTTMLSPPPSQPALPPVVQAPPVVVTGSPYREAHTSQQECPGCAVARSEVAALNAKLSALQDAVDRALQEIRTEQQADRVGRQKVETTLAKWEGAREERARLRAERQGGKHVRPSDG